MASETFNEIMALLSSSKERVGSIVKEINMIDNELEKMRYQVSELEEELFHGQDLNTPRSRELRRKIEDLLKTIGVKSIEKLGILSDVRYANKKLFLRAREKASNLKYQLDEDNADTSMTIEQKVNKTILTGEESCVHIAANSVDTARREITVKDNWNYKNIVPSLNIQPIKEPMRNTACATPTVEKIRKGSVTSSSRTSDSNKRVNMQPINREMPPVQSIYSPQKYFISHTLNQKSNDIMQFKNNAIITTGVEKLIKQTLPNNPKIGGVDVFCICMRPAFGKMILCDGKKCPIGWYHIDCTLLKDIPKGEWLCSKCTSLAIRN